jgi:uncharacterized protein
MSVVQPVNSENNKAVAQHPLPYLGYGLGLRKDHYQHVLETLPAIDWFEVTSENYMIPGGKPLYYLDKIREHYPMVMHGVSLSIGSTDPLNMDYLSQLKILAQRVEPAWISDHLCWTGVGGQNSHDLLPLPYCEEAISHVADRVNQVQDYLQRPILLENVSSYLTYHESEMSEWEFIHAITQKTGCYLLMDINNVYVSARNHNFDPMDYLRGVPADRVVQFHLAGHSDYTDYVIDTHDATVVDAVWKLYEQSLDLFSQVSTMIERDGNIPEFSELQSELAIAKKISLDHSAKKDGNYDHAA